MNHLHMLQQLGKQGFPMCQRVQTVYFYSKVSIHHITAWFPDQLKVSLRWFFFKDINHECLLHMTCWYQVSPFIKGNKTPNVHGQILTPDPSDPSEPSNISQTCSSLTKFGDNYAVCGIILLVTRQRTT